MDDARPTTPISFASLLVNCLNVIKSITCYFIMITEVVPDLFPIDR